MLKTANTLKELVSLANELDNRSLTKEADALDCIIKEASLCSLFPVFLSLIGCGLSSEEINDEEYDHIWWDLQGDKLVTAPENATTDHGCQWFQMYGDIDGPECQTAYEIGWISVTWDLSKMNIDPERSKVRGPEDDFASKEEFLETGYVIDSNTLSAGMYTLYFEVAGNMQFTGNVSEEQMQASRGCCEEW